MKLAFNAFYAFLEHVNSITYVFSITPKGPNPTLTASISPFFRTIRKRLNAGKFSGQSRRILHCCSAKTPKLSGTWKVTFCVGCQQISFRSGGGPCCR